MGGGAMRAAAKVAGMTVANGGIRGVTSDHYPAFNAGRRAASSAVAAMAEDVKLVASKPHAGAKTTSSEMDDWVFAGGSEEGMMLSDGDVMPTVVFDGSPTLLEAKQATSELALALEKAYLSSPDSNGLDGSVVTNEIAAIAPAVPAHTIKAFRLLHDNPVAQNIVASLACDPNVWNAVLHNQELQEFLQSHRKCFACSNMNESSTENIDVTPENEESEADTGLLDIVQKVKITVVDMMSNLSDYFQNIFGAQGVNNALASCEGNANANANAETVMEASFVGLAVMAIMVILVKRA